MPSAADFVKNSILSWREMNRLKNNFVDTSPPDDPVVGVKRYDETTEEVDIYKGAIDEWQPLAPVADPFPIGTILAWIGGYMTDGSNGGYTRVLGSANTAAGANAYLNDLGWYVCNGAAINSALSTIWNAASRYIPNITDDRFLMGDNAAAGLGGSSSRAHTHTANPASIASTAGTVDNNGLDSGAVDVSDATADHGHDLDIAQFTTGAATATENRPKYLAIFYIVRVF